MYDELKMKIHSLDFLCEHIVKLRTKAQSQNPKAE